MANNIISFDVKDRLFSVKHYMFKTRKSIKLNNSSYPLRT